MLLAAFVLLLSGLVAARGTSLPGEAPTWFSARFGRELAGVGVFALGTLGLALGVADVARKTPELGPGIAVLCGWVALRATTRRDTSRNRMTVGLLVSIAALALGEGWAAAIAG